MISGTKAIVTGAPYMHELLVMPCRNMGRDDADFAVCCAVPLDAPGLTIVARPAGRPGEKLEHGDALFSRKYGQSTGVVHVRPRVRAVGAACSTPASGSTPAT